MNHARKSFFRRTSVYRRRRRHVEGRNPDGEPPLGEYEHHGRRVPARHASGAGAGSQHRGTAQHLWDEQGAVRLHRRADRGVHRLGHPRSGFGRDRLVDNVRLGNREPRLAPQPRDDPRARRHDLSRFFAFRANQAGQGRRGTRVRAVLLGGDDVRRGYRRRHLLLRPLRAAEPLPHPAAAQRRSGNPGGAAPVDGAVALPLGADDLGALRDGRRRARIQLVPARPGDAAELGVQIAHR